jgi:hypothetical protein
MPPLHPAHQSQRRNSSIPCQGPDRLVAAIPQRDDVHAAQLMVVIEVLTPQAPD